MPLYDFESCFLAIWGINAAKLVTDSKYVRKKYQKRTIAVNERNMIGFKHYI